MSAQEPQITEIASYFAATLPKEGEAEAAKQAWRSTLRYARTNGTIEPLTEAIQHDAAGDPLTERYCNELRNR